MYLYGKRYETPDKKPIRVIENAIRVDDKPVIEYSPIFVSILYLTKNELIIYCAYVDITRGDLLVEEVNRFFLKDIVEITSTAETSRFKRSEATELFALYEKVFKYSLPNEMAIIYHFLRVTMTDGRYQNLPIGHLNVTFEKRVFLIVMKARRSFSPLTTRKSCLHPRSLRDEYTSG